MQGACGRGLALGFEVSGVRVLTGTYEDEFEDLLDSVATDKQERCMDKGDWFRGFEVELDTPR